MKKGDVKFREYAYLVCTTDDLQLPIYVADTMQEVADFLDITLSGMCHNINRFVSYHLKGRCVERVKIYDYVYVAYENDIRHPLCVARTLKELAHKLGCSITTVSGTYYNRKEQSRKGKKLPPRKIQGKYLIKSLDLLELDINFAEFLRQCLGKGKISDEDIQKYEGELCVE